MKRWSVKVIVPRFTGASIREVEVRADTRKLAQEAGLRHVRDREPRLFELGGLEGVPYATAVPSRHRSG